MLFILAVLAFASAVFLLFRYTRRQSLSIPDTNFQYLERPLGARPLFEPSAGEIAREHAAKEAREIADRKYWASAELNARIDNALNAWRASHCARDAAELLSVAAKSPQEGAFSRASHEIITVFRESGISGLAANDLAALLDSHIMLLPVEVRGSGALFWVKQEVAKLRSENS